MSPLKLLLLLFPAVTSFLFRSPGVSIAVGPDSVDLPVLGADLGKRDGEGIRVLGGALGLGLMALMMASVIIKEIKPAAGAWEP